MYVTVSFASIERRGLRDKMMRIGGKERSLSKIEREEEEVRIEILRKGRKGGSEENDGYERDSTSIHFFRKGGKEHRTEKMIVSFIPSSSCPFFHLCLLFLQSSTIFNPSFFFYLFVRWIKIPEEDQRVL